ncbi:type II toxin-antitoxin system PemK/MazF family toxin [Thermocoleostomius sinensis]|uniref:mRNA interferase n=1 Tax=Thermocoleostomius sinensis A174 TaxID=2016057 RepID=A0A9E8ZEZ8_9CYAN|nr:type II toxin-antitoxin system PemK/MazF family toxin [Thermocoleostomius sinensis]WAL61807.1 type II toxin-antitoxin system PemK/MazF family toxin [Thermocoleostomius sinensis A174]
MYRGEIWWANLPNPVGSEPGYRRPVLVIQDDTFTQSRIRTIIVVIITSNVQLAEAPGNVLLPREVSGLPRDSVVNISQIFTVNKTFLVERVGALPDYLQEEVDEGLRTILYL